MNVLNFLNSKSVAKYLEEINYNFSPQEAAFIVWNSSKPLEEKFAAWKKIINTMPDCAVRCRADCPQYPSLHKFLHDYMSLLSCVGEITDEEKLSEEEYNLYTAFEFMWFNIPTPFKKGDIVRSKSKYIESYDKYVIIDINNWSKEDFIDNGYTDSDYKLDEVDSALAKRATGGDYTDMSAHGYRIFENCTVDYDFFCNYIDFEYCNESELVGSERALKPLSAYMQGKIDLELFLNANKVILEEEHIKEEKSVLYMDDEGLRLTGLKRG